MIGYAITTWNRSCYLKDLIASVYNQSMSVDHIVIVDNKSDKQDMVDLLQALSSSGIDIIKPDSYVGLDIARNIGLKAISDCDVQFISEDAVYMAPNCIKEMVGFLDKFSGVGIVGPQHQAGVPHQNIRIGMDKFVLNFGHESLNSINAKMEVVEGMQQGNGRIVSMVEGHLRGFSKSMVDKIGLPDEGYQKGWNVDTDYCALARHHNYQTAVVYHSLIWHYRDLYYSIEDKEEWRKLGIMRAVEKYGSLDAFNKYIIENFEEKEL